MLTLQSPVVEQTLLDHLNGQPFLVVLLVIFAIYMVRRQNASDAKLEKYIAEDRQKMLDVIENNTLVLKQISVKLQASFLLLFFSLLSFGFMSCRTSKKTISKTVSSDSVSAVSAVWVKSSKSYTKETTIKDTTITIAARSVEDTFQIADFSPLYTAEGKAVPNVKTITGKGIHGQVTALPGGGVAFRCIADSLQMRLNALYREREVLEAQNDSEAREFQARQTYYATEITKVANKRAAFLTCVTVGFFVLMAAVVLFVLYAVKKGVFRA